MTNKLTFDFKTASEYDRGIRRTLPTYDTLFRLIQAFLRSDLDGENELLIVGAGGGNELLTLAPANRHWSFTAVDPSAAMLRLARDKVSQAQLSHQVTFFEGTVDAVPCNQMFDAATSILVLHFIKNNEEKLEQLTAIRQRLKSGAPFIIVAMYGEQGKPEFEKLFSLWKAYWSDTTKLTKKEIDEMETTIKKLSFLPEEEIRQLLKKAGFTRITKFFKTNIVGGWICYTKE